VCYDAFVARDAFSAIPDVPNRDRNTRSTSSISTPCPSNSMQTLHLIPVSRTSPALSSHLVEAILKRSKALDAVNGPHSNHLPAKDASPHPWVSSQLQNHHWMGSDEWQPNKVQRTYCACLIGPTVSHSFSGVSTTSRMARVEPSVCLSVFLVARKPSPVPARSAAPWRGRVGQPSPTPCARVPHRPPAPGTAHPPPHAPAGRTERQTDRAQSAESVQPPSCDWKGE
jgi:hypothetical protein